MQINWINIHIQSQLELSLAQYSPGLLLYFKQAGAELKFSLVRVVNEVTDILNSVEIEIKVVVELSLLFLVGGWSAGKKQN